MSLSGRKGGGGGANLANFPKFTVFWESSLTYLKAQDSSGALCSAIACFSSNHRMNKRGLSCAKLSQQSIRFLGPMELFFLV